MASINVAYTPGDGIELLLDEVEEVLLNMEVKHHFQALMSFIMYLEQVAGYDTSYAVRKLAREMSKPHAAAKQ